MTFPPLILGANGQIKRLQSNEILTANPPSAKVSGSLNIGSGVYTNQSFQTEDWDTNSFFDPASNRKLDIAIAGFYLCGFNVGWESNATGSRVNYISVNAAGNFAYASFPASISSFGCSTVLNLTAGSTVQLVGFQNSGGSLVCTASLYCIRFS